MVGALRPAVAVLRRAAPRAALGVLVSPLLAGVATAAGLLLTTEVLGILLGDAPLAERPRAALTPLLLLLGVQVARLGMEAATTALTAYLTPRVHQVAEEALFRVGLQVDLVAFDDPAFYDRLMRARDRGIMHLDGVTALLAEALGAVFAVGGATLALLWLHPLLVALLVVALLPEAWAAFQSARYQYAGMPTSITLARQVQMLEALATYREPAPELRANQAQDYVLSEYRRVSLALQEHLVRVGMASARVTVVGRVLSGVGLVAVFAALGWMLHAGGLGLAVAGTAVIAIRGAAAAIARLMQLVHQLVEKGLYISDYQEFIDLASPRPLAEGLVDAPAVPGRIALEDVSFSYPGADGRQALRDISFSIEAGQSIALVGENGSGKSTLARLIGGLYRPSAGRIHWDGVDVTRMVPESVSDRVVMVLQDPIRWPRTARENVRLGRHQREDPDSRALLSAAELSRADEVVQTLPRGWETLLSREFQGGQDLSGGQWQRLAVARGLYRDAPVVILDEPTAPLDAKAEHAVYESLRLLARNRTVILITHRLASVRNADRILFLERGALVEQGTHEELMRMNGRYAGLYRLQTRLHGLDDEAQ
ncbi:ATP-binding cassette domain-containing protein [Myxococcus sp. K15C18031901]|uniref:ATP-binding cassette domain-containing protein n=1 Tax=Myxococcus dinghuensis TaxID=2906761 RepID=UPI0020A7FA7C|nr:ATP-binding cassette domain-containing protein [Myxococcus dinghuensis]MCP3097392.1 ATP-binding cassette domain-containing protein [Myxococcus dinghuensis]